MDLIHKPLSLSGPFGWITQQRINVAMALILGATGGYWAGNGHTTQHAVQHVSEQLGTEKQALDKVKKHDDCVTRKAEVATAVANTAVASAIGAGVELPSTSAIPYCPPSPVVKK